jgi:hypothetical protein
MKKTEKILFKLYSFLFIILFYNTAHTACLPISNGVWQTDGNESADVAECISAASAGDTINVIAGDGTATWGASSVIVPSNKPLQIMGPGASNLTIMLSGGPTVVIQSYIGKEYSGGGRYSAGRISGFKFYNSPSTSHQAILANGQGWRIDHCIFHNDGTHTLAPFCITNLSGAVNTQSYGLIDNNSFIEAKINITGASNATSLSAAWSDALDLGGITATYIEDNTFTTNYPTNTKKQLVVDNDSAAKIVVRYNTTTNCDLQTHGLQQYGGRGSRKAEFYANKMIDMNSSVTAYIEIIAGSGVIFANNITGTTGTYATALQNIRSGRSVDCLGTCDGSHAWDGNELSSGWPCRDQPGTGGDAGWDGTCSGAPAKQTKAPIYIWKNLGAANGTDSLFNISPTHIVENRDFYRYNINCTASSCSSGVGVGESTPTGSCTTGVAYWKTSQSMSDITDYTGVNPTTPLSGTLYKCTSTNTWTAYYTPYTYPHPLRGPVATPSGLRIVP